MMGKNDVHSLDALYDSCRVPYEVERPLIERAGRKRDKVRHDV